MMWLYSWYDIKDLIAAIVFQSFVVNILEIEFQVEDEILAQYLFSDFQTWAW